MLVKQSIAPKIVFLLRLKLKLIAAITRSHVAEDCFPRSIQVVFDGLFGQTNSKLRLLTLQYVTTMINRLVDAKYYFT